MQPARQAAQRGQIAGLIASDLRRIAARLASGAAVERDSDVDKLKRQALGEANAGATVHGHEEVEAVDVRRCTPRLDSRNGGVRSIARTNATDPQMEMARVPVEELARLFAIRRRHHGIASITKCTRDA